MKTQTYRKMSFPFVVAGAVLAGGLLAGSAWAANPQLVWTGGGDGTKWSDAANWNGAPDWSVANDLDFTSVAGGTTLVNDATTTFGVVTFGADKGTVVLESDRTAMPEAATIRIPSGTTLDAAFKVGAWTGWSGWKLTVAGGGTLVIDGQWFGTYVGGDLTLDGVTALMKTGMNANGGGSVALKGGARLTAAANFGLWTLTSESPSDVLDLGGKSLTLVQARGTFAGALVGSGVIIPRGACTWTLSGDSPDFSGRIEVCESDVNVTGSLGPKAQIVSVETGTLTVANDLRVAGLSGTAAAGGVAVADGKTLTVTGGGTYGARLSGAGTLALDAAGQTLALAGANAHTGDLDVRAGTLLAVGSDVDVCAGYPSGLVSRYSFDGELTTDDLGAYDLVVSAGAPTPMAGGIGGSRCARFDGAARMQTAANSFISGKTPFTISFWVRTTSTETWEKGGLFLDVGMWSEKGTREIGLGATSADGYALGSLMTFCGNWLWQGTWQTGDWRQYTLTFDGTDAKVYTNGTLSDTKTKDWDLVSTPILLGKNVTADYDEVLVFSRALTADEVKGLYETPIPAPPAAEGAADPQPVAHWAFDDAANPGRDTSGNGFDLSVLGGTLNLTAAGGAYGQAARFADDSAYLKLDGAGLPAKFPSGNASFTVSVRVAGWNGSDGSDLFSLGDVTQAGKSFRITNGNYPRSLGYSTTTASGGAERLISCVTGTGYGTFTFVYDAAAQAMSCYRDGRLVDGPRGVAVDIAAQGTVLIAYNPANPNRRIASALDDVQVFAEALSAPQVRRLVQSLETGSVPGALSGSAAVVREGATLRAPAAVRTGVARLSGAGAVSVGAGGTLAAAAVSGFTGTAFGPGALALAEGGTLDCSREKPAIDMAGTLVLPAVATVSFAESAETIASDVRHRYLVARATSLAGATDLSGWTCRLGGASSESGSVTFKIKGNAVYAKVPRGLAVIVR